MARIKKIKKRFRSLSRQNRTWFKSPVFVILIIFLGFSIWNIYSKGWDSFLENVMSYGVGLSAVTLIILIVTKASGKKVSMA